MFDCFPLVSDEFRLNFGVQAVSSDQPIIVVTDEYEAETELKTFLSDQRRDCCWAALPESIEAQVEAVGFLKTRCSPSHPLASFGSTQQGAVGIKRSDSVLLMASRVVQEDLVILRHDVEAGFPVIAGSVCFPSGWSIADKLGQSQGCVHAAVPGFDQELLSPSLRLFERLKTGRSVCRHNWSVRALGRLAQFSQDAAEVLARSQQVTVKTAADCFFRVEYQTLSRLPETRSILFTIHTFQRTLKELTCAEKRRLARVMLTCPESSLRYKGIWPMRENVVSYLTTAQ